MNILVTGANGQLGREIKKVVDGIGNGQPNHYVGDPNYYIFARREDLDISDEQAVMDFVKKNHISVIVNCAAYTDVEKAQTDRERAYDVNAKGPMNLAFAASAVGAVLIHISTDYVFGGTRNTPVPPVSVGEDAYNFPDIDRDDCFYGYSKNIGEHLIQQVKDCRYIIIRTSWLYSEYGKNFVKTMARRALDNAATKVVYDQTGSPTYAGDLANFIVHIIEDNSAETRYLSKTGVYNFANKGVASWYDFAMEIFFYYSPKAGELVSPCRSNEFPSTVKRPAYSVLDTEKTEKTFNYRIPYWTDSLTKILFPVGDEIMRQKEEYRQSLELDNTEFDYGHNVQKYEDKEELI